MAVTVLDEVLSLSVHLNHQAVVYNDTPACVEAARSRIHLAIQAGRPITSAAFRVLNDHTFRVHDIQDREPGVTYRALFAEYLAGADWVKIVDPYIRQAYQVDNLKEFLQTVSLGSRCRGRTRHNVRTPSLWRFRRGDSRQRLDELQRELSAAGKIQFSYDFDSSIHDRQIETTRGRSFLDAGWTSTIRLRTASDPPNSVILYIYAGEVSSRPGCDPGPVCRLPCLATDQNPIGRRHIVTYDLSRFREQIPDQRGAHRFRGQMCRGISAVKPTLTRELIRYVSFSLYLSATIDSYGRFEPGIILAEQVARDLPCLYRRGASSDPEELLEAWDLVDQIRDHIGYHGMYEILDYRSTLDLSDATGEKAHISRRQVIRFLQDNIVAIHDHAWGDGKLFARVRVPTRGTS